MTRDSADDVTFKQLVEIWLRVMRDGRVDEMARGLRDFHALGGGRITRITPVRPP